MVDILDIVLKPNKAKMEFFLPHGNWGKKGTNTTGSSNSFNPFEIIAYCGIDKKLIFVRLPK